MLNFVFIFQNWMYLYGCSNHYPDPLKEKIGSKDSKTRSPQMQMKKVDALTLVRQHTAITISQSNRFKTWIHTEPSKRWLEMLFLSKWSLGVMNLQQKKQNWAQIWNAHQLDPSWRCLQNQLGSVPTSTDTACVTDLGAMRARLTSVASKNFGTALLLTIKESEMHLCKP